MKESISGAIEDREVLYGRCRRLSAPFPMGAIIDALSSAPRPSNPLNPVVGALRPILPELSYLPPTLPILRDSIAELHRVWRGLQQLLDGLGEVTLAIDDFHLADQTTREFIDFLIDEIPEGLVVVLAGQNRTGIASSLVLRTRRSRPKLRCEHIALDVFGEANVAELVEARLGRLLDNDLIQEIHRTTGGVAFAVEEVAATLPDGPLSIAEVRSAGSDAILRRYRMMSAFARTVIDVAAVIEHDLEPDVLAVALDKQPDLVSEALAEALDVGVLIEAKDGLHFRHSILREAVYETLDPKTRQQLHQRCAIALGTLSPTLSSRLVHHYRAAGHIGRACAFAESGAVEALRSGDYQAAYSILHDVVGEDPRSTNERAPSIFLYSEAATHRLQVHKAEELVQDLLRDEELSEDWRRKLTLQLARLLSHHDRAAAVRLLRRNLSRFDKGSAAQVRALAYLASPYVFEGTADQHLEWLHRAALAAKELQNPLSPQASAEEASILIDCGKEEGWRLLDKLRGGEADPDPRRAFRSWVTLAESLTWAGDLGSAVDCLIRALGISKASPDPRFDFDHAVIRLVIDWRMGQWDGLHERALRLEADSLAHPTPAAEPPLVLGSVLLSIGQHHEADHLLNRAQERAFGYGHVPAAIAVLGERGRLASIRGDLDAARHHVLEGLSLARAKRMATWEAIVIPHLLDVLFLNGFVDPVLWSIDDFERRTRECAFPLREPTFAHAEAVLSSARATAESSREAHNEAGLAWERASSTWAACQRPLHAAMATERAGESFSGVDRDLAERHFRAAADIFDRSGASWELHRVERHLRELGTSWQRRRGRKGYGQSLSPREAETVELARAGKTNKEIASILFVSEKTVESHLASARRKTGFARRVKPVC